MSKFPRLFLLFLILSAMGISQSLAKSPGNSSLMEESVPDLTLYLAPPPAQDSKETKAEIDEILRIQKTRTPEQEAAAQADTDETGFAFADVMGPNFSPGQLPLTADLLKKVHEVEGALTDPAKDFYKRPRPYLADKRVQPCVRLSKSFSYPSGHATGGTAVAILLAHMVPEKKTEILARGLEYAENRVVGGVHYRSDIVAGQRAGTLLAKTLLKDKTFKKEFKEAKKELRKVLKLKE